METTLNTSLNWMMTMKTLTIKPMTASQYKALREKLGTQAHVAALLGVRVLTIKRREAGGTITHEATLAIKTLSGT